jgi:hypothetical protein
MTGLELMMIAQLAGSVGQAGRGVYQTVRAQRELNKLKRQKMPSVLEARDPYMENIRMARKQYEGGLDPATQRMIREQASRSQVGAFRQAGEMGQSGQALSRLAGLNQYQSSLQLGQMDAAARQRGMSSLMGANLQYGSLLREDARSRRQYRMALEQQLGYAKQEGIQNIMGAYTGAAKTATNVGSQYGGGTIPGTK